MSPPFSGLKSNPGKETSMKLAFNGLQSRYIAEDRTARNHRSESLTSHTIFVLFCAGAKLGTGCVNKSGDFKNVM
jgi:hypothetical protein